MLQVRTPQRRVYLGKAAKITCIVTRIRAATRRYRCGRLAAVVVALYLTAVTAALVIAAVTGELWTLSMAATVSMMWGRPMEGAWLAPLLTAICVLNAWMLWQVLRGPVLPRAEGLPRSVVWLRRLLYIGIAGDLVFWELVEELSDTVEDLASTGVWVATVILLVRVVSGVSARFQAIALTLGLIGALRPVLGFLDLRAPQMLAIFVWTVMILIAQRRDGRWSATTVIIGWISLAPSLVHPLISPLGEWLFEGPGLVLNALGVFGTVWLARTAHELAGPTEDTTTRPAGSRVLVAVALVLPLTALSAEEGARLTFSSADEACPAQIRPYADTLPRDRSWSFLCVARSETGTGQPLFPEDLADQRVLAYGEKLCAVSGADGRQAMLKRAGGSTDTSRLHDAIEYLCPDVVARWTADLRSEAAEQERELAAWHAEMNARCTDPWPKVRATRQGTSAYLLFEGGGYSVFDDRDETGGEGGDIFKAIEDGFIDAAGSSAAISTYGENAPMCLTVKAFGSRPPLRLKGWDRVVEVGIVSRGGHLGVPPYPEGGDSGTLLPLPNLAVGGPGGYRMRVYARAFEWQEDDPDAPVEEHLIVVYPGASTKKIVHRP